MSISVKRAYDAAAKADGLRVLVDRLWPRGMRKRDLQIDAWEKDLAPSSKLRTWLHKDPEKRYKDFAAAYRKELAEKKEMGRALVAKRKRLTLITAARDVAHSHIPTLRAFLSRVSKKG